jgi:polyhydroxyalkanoate synthesis regulator phasin
MAVKISKKNPARGKEFLKLRLEKINNIVTRLEKEVEGLFKRLVRKGERSSRELRHNFDDILKRLKKTDILTKAQEKTEDFEREVRRLADDIVDKVKSLEIAPSGFSAKKLLKDTRKNLDHFMVKIEKSNWISKARLKAENTRANVFSLLSIPSQSEVEKLEKKIASLEKRLQNLSQKAA